MPLRLFSERECTCEATLEHFALAARHRNTFCSLLIALPAIEWWQHRCDYQMAIIYRPRTLAYASAIST
jgi:hypothetical protein